MNRLETFFKTTKGKIVLSLLLILVIVFIIILPKLLSTSTEMVNPSRSEIDPISGETIYYTGENEQNTNKIAFIGVQKMLKEMGFTYKQQDAILDTLKQYFTNAYPDGGHASYQQKSFRYNPNNPLEASFIIVFDLSDSYNITINLVGAGATPITTVTPNS